MIRFSVRQDYQRLGHRLDAFERRQLPFAAARALTATAKAAQGAEERAIGSVFDRPTPFTQRGVAITPAKKTALKAEVFVKPIQATYLGLQDKGGTRRPKRSALVNPAGIKLDRYGNIPAKALARLKRRKDVFIGRVGKVGGVWQRPKKVKGTVGKPVLLMRFDGPERVRRRPFWDAPIAQIGRREFPRLMREALAEALRTARR
nr:hypothetical protein [uncultured Roseococcus sp.]